MTDRPLIFRRDLRGLVATDDASEAALKSVKLGARVEVKIKSPRNLQMHRLFWKLMQTVYENQDHYESAQKVCDAFKYACGLYETHRTKYGEYVELQSISFAKMDQSAFREFFDKALHFCVTEVIPGLDSAELEREVMELING